MFVLMLTLVHVLCALAFCISFSIIEVYYLSKKILTKESVHSIDHTKILLGFHHLPKATCWKKLSLLALILHQRVHPFIPPPDFVHHLPPSSPYFKSITQLHQRLNPFIPLPDFVHHLPPSFPYFKSVTQRHKCIAS